MLNRKPRVRHGQDIERVRRSMATVSWNENDLFYVCSMIEFVARKTCNKRKDIVAKMSDKALGYQLKVAGVNHCLSFE